MRGQPISEYQRGVIYRMVRQGCEEINRIANRAELHPTTVRAFIIRELRVRLAAEHKAAELDEMRGRE
jgi:hypothetical protein